MAGRGERGTRFRSRIEVLSVVSRISLYLLSIVFSLILIHPYV